MQISKLTCKNEIFDKILDWYYEWWGKGEGWSKEKVEYFLLHSINNDRLPVTYYAHEGDDIKGVYQISMFDLDVRPDIYPWLINIYVDEKSRGEGICRKLVFHAEKTAREMGYDELFLYTHHKGLYEKFGYKFFDNTETFRGDTETILKIDL